VSVNAVLSQLEREPVEQRGRVSAGQAADWLRLARVDRLLDHATPRELSRLAILERVGCRRLTQTVRGWHLDV